MENQALTIALTLVSVASTLALLVNWLSNRDMPGLQIITAGFALASLGLLLSSLGSLPAFISVLLANGLIMGGRIPIVIGLARFWNQNDSKLPLYTGICFLLTMAAFTFFTVANDDPAWRVRIYTLMMVIFSGCNIFIIATGLVREREEQPLTATSSSFGAFLALILFAFNAVTDIILMIVQTSPALADAEQGTSFILLGSIFTGVVFAFAIIIMTMEKLALTGKEESVYDPITTIINQRTFTAVGERMMGVALRYSRPVSLLCIEIENMNTLIKQHGFTAGNELLRHFAALASDRRRNEDVLARFGLSQFRMLLPGVDEAGAQVVITKIKKALATQDFVYRGETVDIQLSIAAVTRKEDDLVLEQIMDEGEVALYRVRQQAGLLN